VETAKFYCGNCRKKVFLKNGLKNEQKIECPHCGVSNRIIKENGKVKAKVSL
jgi:DNA-directed RNA polymerase subunit RPC12/RpoP